MHDRIESPQNPRLKELRKLHDRKHRERTGLFFAEGEDLVGEALRFDVPPLAVFYDADDEHALGELLDRMPREVERVGVRAAALKASGSLGSGSRVIGLFEQRWTQVDDASAGVALYLHEVADPGNVGATLRAAQALASALVIVSPGTADPYGPKAVRASMGAVFGQPISRATFEQVRAQLGERWRAVALAPRAGRALRDLDHERPLLYCLGSERRGLPAAIVNSCELTAHVPLRSDGPESLNVAMAATLCLYEHARLDPGGRP